MNGTIKIRGKAYKYAFNQKSRRLYMEAKGIEYWDDFAEQMQRMEPHPKKGMSLPGMMVFASLVIAGIRAVDPEFDDFDEDQLLEALIADPKSMQKLMQDMNAAAERIDSNSKQKSKTGKTGNKSVPSSSGKKSKGAAG